MRCCGGAQSGSLGDTLDWINPTRYQNTSSILTILLTMPVSAAILDRSFSLMRKVKTHLTENRAELSNGHTKGHVTEKPWLMSFAARIES